jgi:hypothetical protein
MRRVCHGPTCSTSSASLRRGPHSTQTSRSLWDICLGGTSADRKGSLQLRIPRPLRRSRRTRPGERPGQQNHRNPPRKGPGLSFVGRQFHFDVDGDDYYVDRLFFHIEQSRCAVIELKTGKFQPEYAGKLNFYGALVDDVLRRAPQRNHRDPHLRHQVRSQRPVKRFYALVSSPCDLA